MNKIGVKSFRSPNFERVDENPKMEAQKILCNTSQMVIKGFQTEEKPIYPKYMEDVEIRSVSIKYKGELRSITIHAIKELPGSSRPLNINTPLLGEACDEEENESGNYLPQSAVELLDELIEEANKYLDGKRAPKPEQLKLVS